MYDKYTKQTYKTNTIEIRNKIEETFKSYSNKPKITIILMNNPTRHERQIITTYKTYISGDSFNYYDLNKNIMTKDENFSVFNYAIDKRLRNTKKYIDRLQMLIKTINVFGDEDSVIFKFH